MNNVYGRWLKKQREARGMTQQELADAAIMTRSHISHIEAGRRIPSRDDARRLDKALGTGDVLTSFLPEGDEGIADHFAAAREFEQQATMIREYAPSLVPGFLHTETYARAVMCTSFPPLTDEERDKRVVARLDRGKFLSDSVFPVVWVLLDETVLRRPVGGPAVMAEQLMHLAELSEKERVRVHVLPFARGAHSLLDGMVKLMWFDDQPPVAYVEGKFTGKVHDSPAVVDRFQSVYHLALSDALSRQESLALLRATAEDYGHHD